MRLIQVNVKLRPKKSNNNKNQQKKKTKNKNKNKNKTKQKKLIGNLKVTTSLNVDFTKFARAVFWLPSFYF